MHIIFLFNSTLQQIAPLFMKRLVPVFILILLNFSAAAQKPFVLGETVEIQSEVLGEKRVLNVYLPESYKKSDTSSYRVIFLLDGSYNEDFPHIAGLVQFYEMMGLMPEAIVVGIGNVDRRRDFTFPISENTGRELPAKGSDDPLKAFMEKEMRKPGSGGSGKFMDFVEKELQPYVRKHYRTGASTLIGQSLGGLMATEILAKRPQLFDDYIIVSPSLWWDHESLLMQVDARKLSGKTVYIAVGKEGDVMEQDAAQLANILKQNKAVHISFHPFERETHATILHNAVYEAFRGLYSKHYMGE